MDPITQRRVLVDSDRATLLDFHCCVNYASDSPWAKAVPFDEYRERWLSTPQTETYLSDLAQSLEDERTIAEIWENNGVPIGYVWARFTDIPEHGFTFAELWDLIVVPAYRRRGIASKMLLHVEELARSRGAHALRSAAAWETGASRGLHTKLGFNPIEMRYEKLLEPISSDRL